MEYEEIGPYRINTNGPPFYVYDEDGNIVAGPFPNIDSARDEANRLINVPKPPRPGN